MSEKNDTSNQNLERCFSHNIEINESLLKSHSGAWVMGQVPCLWRGSQCLAPGEWAGHTQGGFDILPYFHAEFPVQGPNAGVKYPFPGSECMIFIMLMSLK